MSSSKQTPKRKRPDFDNTDTEFPPLAQRRRQDLSGSDADCSDLEEEAKGRRKDSKVGDTYCSDSEEEVRTQAEQNGIQDSWPRFFLVEGKEESKPVSKISPFLINQ